MYAFVHIEKTGGTTLNAILRRSFGTGHCDIRLPLAKRRNDRRDQKALIEAADLRRVRALYRNLRGIAGHNVKAYSNLCMEFPEIQFITMLREPAARFRSHFLNRAPGHSPKAFDEWISAEWVHNWQTKMIAGEANAQKAIDLIALRFGFVGLTERFDESLLLMGNWLDEPAFRAQYRAVNCMSEKRRPRDLEREKSDMSYLNSWETRARIAEANDEDQKLYDYVVSKIYPNQVAAYAGNLQADVCQLRERNRAAEGLTEPFFGGFLRNFVYKPLLHCHVM